MVSIGLARQQFFFFVALVGLLIGVGYISTEQTSLATGRPLQLPIGRDAVTLQVEDHGSVLVDQNQVRGVVRFTSGHDDFSYLLLDQLDHALSNLTVTLHWPRAVAPDQAQVRAIVVHTDPTTWTWHWRDSQTLIYQFEQTDPGASISLLVQLPKGVIEPSLTQRLFGTIRSLPQIVWLSFALVLPLVTFFILALIWFGQARVKRLSQTDQQRPSPPEALAPAAVSALVDGRVSARSLAATLFDLARREYLDIGRSESGYVFTKRRRLLEDKAALTSYETALLAKLFPAAAVQATAEDVRIRIGSSLFSRRVAEVYLGIYEDVTDRGYFHANPSQLQAGYRQAGLALFFLGVIGFGYGMTLFADAPTPLLFWVGMIVAALLIIQAGPKISNYTSTGLVHRREWLAFRNYLISSQTPTFSMQNQEDFFRYLPLAIALGVEVIWARRFLKAPFHLPSWYATEERVVRLEDFVNDIFPMVGFLARELAAVKEPTLS